MLNWLIAAVKEYEELSLVLSVSPAACHAVSISFNFLIAFTVSMLAFYVFQKRDGADGTPPPQEGYIPVKKLEQYLSRPTILRLIVYQIAYAMLTALISTAIIEFEQRGISIFHSVAYALFGPFTLSDRLRRLVESKKESSSPEVVENVERRFSDIDRELLESEERIKRDLLKDIQKKPRQKKST